MASGDLPLYQMASWSFQPFDHNRHGPKSGGCFAFLRGARCPSNTMSPGPRLISVSSGVLMHLAVWPQQTWAKNWGSCALYWGGELVPISHNVAWAAACHHTKTSQSIEPFGYNTPTSLTKRQDKQDRQRSDSIGRTKTCTYFIEFAVGVTDGRGSVGGREK